MPDHAPLFTSIVFEKSADADQAQSWDMPGFFHDLNLDQIVDAITVGRDEYNLTPLYYRHLSDLPTITYRQEIMLDMQDEPLFTSIKTFSAQMRNVRRHLSLAEKGDYPYQKKGYFLEAAQMYGQALLELQRHLTRIGVQARGLRAFQSYLNDYIQSQPFNLLYQEAQRLTSDLAAIRYCIFIKDSSVTVRRYAAETNYTLAVAETFARFQQGVVKDYRVKLAESDGMNHVEGAVLARVAQLYPVVFGQLDTFCQEHEEFLDPPIIRFDREVQFYLAYLEYLRPLQRAGLKFCYPQLSDGDKNIHNRGGFDLALATKLTALNATVVCNDFTLHGSERIFIVSGPNQGGKTTFARTFGQLHYLASLGCPVAGTEARLFLCDRIFTHFEREEDITTLRGKLQDDLVRMHHILQEATPQSIVIMNELFSSTSVKDGLYLGTKILERLAQMEAFCVCVTFLDALSRLNDKTVSLVAAVSPDNPTVRTHRIERKFADGLSFALALAEKHGVTYQQLKERMKP